MLLTLMQQLSEVILCLGPCDFHNMENAEQNPVVQIDFCIDLSNTQKHMPSLQS